MSESENLNTSVNKKPHRKVSFKKGLIIYLTTISVLLFGVLIYLWISLSNYQKDYELQQEEESRQMAEMKAEKEHQEAVRRAPQLAFEGWYQFYTVDQWTALWFETYPDSLETEEHVYAYMEAIFDKDACECLRSSNYSPETPEFVIKNGDQTLARITVEGSDTSYKVTNVSLEFQGEVSSSITVPQGSEVFLNGCPLPAEMAGPAASYFQLESKRDELISPVLFVTYTATGLLDEPVWGYHVDEGYYVTTAEDGSYLLNMNDDLGEYVTRRAVSFVKSYLNYYTSGANNTEGNMNAVLNYLVTGTQAYRDIVNSYDGVLWVHPYSSLDTSNVTAEPAVLWAQNCCSVDVPMNATGITSGTEMSFADTTMRIYFFMGSENWVITNFEIY